MRSIFSLFVFLSISILADGHASNPLVGLRNVLENNVRVSIDSSITLTTNKRVLQKSGDWITVTLSGVKKPNVTDIIALYSPADANPATTSPIRFLSAEQFGGQYLTRGSANVRFNIINMRSDFRFVFIRNVPQIDEHWESFNSTIISSRSNRVSFSNPNEPLQGHLALTGKAGQMKVMWASGSGSSLQQLRYGTSSGKYQFVLPAKGSTYKAEQLCGAPANSFGWKDPGFLFTATAVGLKEGERYYYVYGSKTTGWSTESSFVAPKQAGANTSLNFLAFGDMGKSQIDGSIEHWNWEMKAGQTMQKIIQSRDHIDLVLHVGDVSYAVGYSSQWDEFMEQIKPVASYVPWMTLPGNHERDFPNSGSLFNGSDSGGECGIPYEMRFPMPGVPSMDQLWYSFNSGPVHFVTMSTEHDFSVGSSQYKWIENDLKSVDRKVHPWIVFSGHRPMYIDSTNYDVPDGDQTVAKQLRDNLESLLTMYKVDLAFWGHHHTYQRTCPVNQMSCVKEGTVHVVVGMAGFGLTHNIMKTKPDYMVYVDDTEHGVAKISVDSNKLHLQYVGNLNGVKDEFTLYKK